MKYSYLILPALALAMACNSKKEVKLPNGVKVLYHQRESGAEEKTAKKGDFLSFHITYRNFKDSVLGSTRKDKKPIMVKLNGQTPRDLFEGCFGYMAAGDSATYFIPVDSLFKGAPEGSRPAFLPKGTEVKFSVSVQKVENEKAMLSRLDSDIEKFVKTDATKKYLKQPNGLQISMTTMGPGITPAAGDTVSVNYRGRVVGSTEIFDESYSRGQAFQFVLGRGEVIRGWDEAIAMLTEGSEATILVPFALGYGEAGSPPAIPPYSTLVFDVKLEKVKKGKGLVPTPAIPPMPAMPEAIK